MNIAVGLGRMNVPVGFFSRLSTDFFGDLLSSHLNQNGVDLQFCPRIDGPTILAFVNTKGYDSEEPQYAFYAANAVDRTMTVGDLPESFNENVQALHFGSISLLLEPGASALEQLMIRESRKRLLTLDPNVRPILIPNPDTYRQRFFRWIKLVDILRLSQADYDFLYPNINIKDVLPDWFNDGVCLAILTQGPKGATAYLPNGIECNVKAPKVRVKDTIGAGDTFFSATLAFLYENKIISNRCLISEMNIDELNACLCFAVNAAAINCTREGANPPYRHEMKGIVF